MSERKALISGITGQDGSYLAELLVGKGYVVHGIVRRASQSDATRFRNLKALVEGKKVQLHYADLSDPTALRRILHKVEPDEFYHLAGQSHVGLSFEIPESTFREVAGATLSLLEMCRDLPNPPRIYHAGSSEIFGEPAEKPQTEETPYMPVSPYGCSKAFAVNLCRVYRQSYGLYVSTGIVYNHESIRRGSNFVTKKVTSTAAKVSLGKPAVLELGNLNAQRDWGYAPEYVEGMWRILQHKEASEFILATGVLTTLRDFVVSAYKAAGIYLEFRGDGIDEKGVCAESGEILLRVNPQFFRPADPTNLVGDPKKAEVELGWKPFLSGGKLAARMVEDELQELVR